MSTSYWKRAYENQAASALKLRDQVVGLEAEVVALRRENARLLAMFKQLAQGTHYEALISSPPPNDQPGRK